jgi:hypothetical protein
MAWRRLHQAKHTLLSRSKITLLSLHFPNPRIQVVLKELRGHFIEDPGWAKGLTKVRIVSAFLQIEPWKLTTKFSAAPASLRPGCS